MKGKHQIVNDYSCLSERTRETKEILNVGGFCFVFWMVSTIAQTGLKLIPPVSTLRMLEFPFCSTTPGLHLLEYFSVLYMKGFLEENRSHRQPLWLHRPRVFMVLSRF